MNISWRPGRRHIVRCRVFGTVAVGLLQLWPLLLLLGGVDLVDHWAEALAVSTPRPRHPR